MALAYFRTVPQNRNLLAKPTLSPDILPTNKLWCDSFREFVGGGILECRIDFGPGYRVYFGREGDKIFILLGERAKKRQKKYIEGAKAL